MLRWFRRKGFKGRTNEEGKTAVEEYVESGEEKPDWVDEVERYEDDMAASKAVKNQLMRRACLVQDLGLSPFDLPRLTPLEQNNLIRGRKMLEDEREKQRERKRKRKR